MRGLPALRAVAALLAAAAALGRAGPCPAGGIGAGGDLERYADHLVAGRRTAEPLYAVRLGSYEDLDEAVAAATRLRDCNLPFFVRLDEVPGEFPPGKLELLVVSRADSASAGAIAARLLDGGLAAAPKIEVGWPEDVMRRMAILVRVAVLSDGSVAGAELLQPTHPGIDHMALTLAGARKLRLSGIPRSAIMVLPLDFTGDPPAPR